MSPDELERYMSREMGLADKVWLAFWIVVLILCAIVVYFA